MARMPIDQTLLWCSAGLLMIADFFVPSGDLGRLAILFSAFALTRAVGRGFRDLRHSFESSVGKAYKIGRRAERREQEAADLAPVSVLRR